ncbi:MAG: DUF3791 domain-containing protein [Planctomycetaceae bacterium]|jgi:hypothetical protein|nr:DUF3791 domain-containing protein [Planctomycetaceae bacterium]
MWREIDPVATMQMQIARLYRQRHKITIKEFLELDRKTNVLEFIAIGYEPFHLTGEEGILNEVDEYCKERLAWC